MLTRERIAWKRILKTEELLYKHALTPLGAYLRSFTQKEPKASLSLCPLI